MAELVQANWILLIIALVIGVIVAWWVFAANRKTKVEIEAKDDAASPAKRNQSLIDAAPAAPSAVKDQAGTASVAAAVDAAVTEPSAAAPAPVAEPAPEAAAPVPPPVAPAPAPASDGDDLTQIKGLGPKLKAQLADMGITSFAQIAAWDDAEIDRVDAQLGRFQGRIRRDSWVEQAKLLSAGDRAAYENQFGRT